MAYQKEKATPYEVTNPEIAKVGICLLEQDRYQDKTQTSPQSQLSSPNPLIVKRSGSPIFSQNQTKTKTNIGITPQDDSIQTFISNLTAGSKLKEKVNFIESQKKEFYAARQTLPPTSKTSSDIHHQSSKLIPIEPSRKKKHSQDTSPSRSKVKAEDIEEGLHRNNHKGAVCKEEDVPTFRQSNRADRRDFVKRENSPEGAQWNPTSNPKGKSSRHQTVSFGRQPSKNAIKTEPQEKCTNIIMEGDNTPIFRHRSKRAPRQTANVICDDDDEYLEVAKFN